MKIKKLNRCNLDRDDRAGTKIKSVETTHHESRKIDLLHKEFIKYYGHSTHSQRRTSA